MAKLKAYIDVMRSGKSTLALSIYDGFKRNGQVGLLFSTSKETIESRWGKGYEVVAIKIDEQYNFQHLKDKSINYIIIDECQFLTPAQINQLGKLVDYYNINVYCFGLKTDFRGKMFKGTKVLLEDSDEDYKIQSKALCWCGKKATHNARIDGNGYMVEEGDLKVIGEEYETLCRKHFKGGITKAVHVLLSVKEGDE